MNLSNFVKIDSPYPHIIVDNFVGKEFLQDLNEVFSDFPYTSTSEQNTRLRLDFNFFSHPKNARHFVAWNKFISFFSDQDTFNYLSSIFNIPTYKLGTDVGFLGDVSLTKDGYNQAVHTDFEQKILVLLFSLNSKAWGEGDFNLHSSKDSYPILSYPAVENRLLVFESNSSSYHSVVTQTNSTFNRRFVYGSYFKKNND